MTRSATPTPPPGIVCPTSPLFAFGDTVQPRDSAYPKAVFGMRCVSKPGDDGNGNGNDWRTGSWEYELYESRRGQWTLWGWVAESRLKPITNEEES